MAESRPGSKGARDAGAARRRLAAIPGFSTEIAAAAQIARLPGLTNLVYKVDCLSGRFALRIPGEGTTAIIDRRVEETNARSAARAGVAPEVVFFGVDGVMLTRFIDGAEPLTPARLKSDPGALERTALTLKHLHRTTRGFERDFNAFAIIDAYVGVLAAHGRALSEEERSTVAAALSTSQVLLARPARKVPCHCDPTGPNLLDTGERVWLIDWEYSGLNDPMWDIAYLSIEAGLDDGSERALIRAYFGREPRRTEAARVTTLKPAAEILAALWALIRDAQDNHAANFRGYAVRAFARSRERMEAPEFAACLATLRRS